MSLPRPRAPLSDEQMSMVLSAIAANLHGKGPPLCCGTEGKRLIAQITRDPFWRFAIQIAAYNRGACNGYGWVVPHGDEREYVENIAELLDAPDAAELEAIYDYMLKEIT
jgi:hypothetical protein